MKGTIKLIALIIVPGAIPVWLGYKLYDRLQRKRDDNGSSDSDVTKNRDN